MRAPSFVRRVNNLGERHEVSTSAVAGGSRQNPTRTAEPASAVAVAAVIAFTSPDHPITRSPDHPITRSPDHPITRSLRLLGIVNTSRSSVPPLSILYNPTFDTALITMSDIAKFVFGRWADA